MNMKRSARKDSIDFMLPFFIKNGNNILTAGATFMMTHNVFFNEPHKIVRVSLI
jgi:hypothetical protein